MIITLLESKFLLAIPLELLSPGRSGNAQTSDNIICISSSLTLLSFFLSFVRKSVCFGRYSLEKVCVLGDYSLEKVYLCRGVR